MGSCFYIFFLFNICITVYKCIVHVNVYVMFLAVLLFRLVYLCDLCVFYSLIYCNSFILTVGIVNVFNILSIVIKLLSLVEVSSSKFKSFLLHISRFIGLNKCYICCNYYC